jgi:hypothetical protein
VGSRPGVWKCILNSPIGFARADINAWCTAFFGKVLDKHQSDVDITGFSLVYPFCAIFMIEVHAGPCSSILDPNDPNSLCWPVQATMSVITALLSDIAEADQNDSRVQDTKVRAPQQVGCMRHVS